MLSDDVAEKGYTLLCVAVPKSDCQVKTISEVRRLEKLLGVGVWEALWAFYVNRYVVANPF